MDDLLKEIGLKYAEHMLPSILWTAVGPVLLVGWAFYKVWKGEWLDPSTRQMGLCFLAGVGVVFIAQLPVAYNAAKSHCRDLWNDRGTVGGSLYLPSPSGLAGISYRSDNCHRVWPCGPDRPIGYRLCLGE